MFEGSGDEKQIVLTDKDGTMLHSVENGRSKLTVKLGIMYSGREIESGREEYKSYRVVGKGLYGGFEVSEESVSRLYPGGELGSIQSVE